MKASNHIKPAAAGYGKCTVAKVQIGLTGTAVSLKRELERIAKRADTNTSEGLNYVLQGELLVGREPVAAACCAS